ncbi:hypothetical protein ACLEPN_15365 [Myxococcus sp. 1LA]
MGATLLLAALSASAEEAPRPDDTWKADLRAHITRARQENPNAFSRFDTAAAQVDALDETKRGTLAAVSPGLRALGPEALWPMVERLAFPPMDVSRLPTRESARLAFTVGLVEATGALRDARLAPLWKGLLEGPGDTAPQVLHAAAGALARLETLEAANTLITLSRRKGASGEAAMEALGLCRRLVATRALAEALDARPERETMRRLARALGDAGSAWAWKTSRLKARSEEGAIRRVAAEALVRAYWTRTATCGAPSPTPAARDARQTPALIDAARGHASPAQQAALDALAERLRRNPLR